MKKIIAIIALITSSFTFAQNPNTSFHRAKIYYNDAESFERLYKAGIAVDHGIHKKNTYFESDFSEAELLRVEQLGFTIEKTILDVNSYYRNQNDPTHKDYVGPTPLRNASCTGGNTDYQTPANFNVFPANQYGGFYTYSQLLQELDDMVALYPGLITAKSDISTFVTDGQPDNGTTPSIGGNGIKWVKISDNPNSNAEGEPQILYTSIHHAREPASLSQLVFFMWYLLENYATDPEVQAIVDNTELYFVPVINPDGYLYNELTNPAGGGNWRKNRKNGNGTDNNRNYDYYINGDPNNGTWSGPGSSSNPGSSVYHGTAPFSEVENQAIKWFVEQHNFVMAINNHTFGQLLYYPWGYADLDTPDHTLYQGITAEMVSQNGYNALNDFPFSGDSDDFMYGTVGTHQKIFAMTPEIGNSFWPAQSTIEELCKDMMYLNLTAANMVSNYATIEDTSVAFVEMTSSAASYRLKRLGVVDPSNFTVSINPISANILSVGAPVAHNNVALLQEINGSIAINLDPAIGPGESIDYELIINNGFFNRVVPVSRIFGQPMLIFDEPGNDTATNWTTTDWASTTEDFVSATSSITDSPNTNYSNNENNIITLSNEIDLTGVIAANLTFQAKWNIENNFDYVQLEVSTNNGTSWIPQCGQYTNEGVPNQGGAENEPLYDGIQLNWIKETIDLSDYIDESILFRFILISDDSVREDGFYFDDLQVNILENNLGVDDFISQNFSVYPNPVKEQLMINSLIQNYDLTVYSIQGQLLFNSRNRTGNTTIDYSNFSEGIYLLKIESGNRSQTLKIIKQ